MANLDKYYRMSHLIKNFHFGYLKGARFEYAFEFCLFCVSISMGKHVFQAEYELKAKLVFWTRKVLT